MSRESESEQTQRTVAELLAQYGASAGDAAPRRRRRRAEDPTDTAPQAIIERINSDSGEIPVVNPEVEPPTTRAGRRAKQEEPDAERTAYQAPVQAPRAEPPPPRVDPRRAEPPRAEPPRVEPRRPDPARAEPPVRQEPPRRPEPPRAEPPRVEPPRAGRADTRRSAVPPVDPAEETRQVPPITDDFDPSRPAIPKPAGMPEPSRPNLVRPVVKSPLAKPPLAKPPIGKPPMPPGREPMTEQIPRIPGDSVPLEAQVTASVPILPPAPPKLPDPLPDVSPEEWFGDDDDEFAEQEHTQAHAGPYVDEEDDYSDNYAVDYESGVQEEPAGLADLDDEEDEEVERSPVKEWLVMIGQLAVGVLGGAALWLGFNWLWRTVPAAALVVALGVTVGLVLLVRKIRRADDLQTTLLAVLVGLIVTVSPAAMLLVKS